MYNGESGLIPIVEPITSLKLDTPAGLVEVDIFVRDGKAKEVSFCNIPAFVLKHITVDVENIGTVEADIAYGGTLCHYRCEISRVRVSTRNASTIIDKAIHIRNIINERFEIIHPEYSFIRGLTHVSFIQILL